ncbi:hypothetical protein ACFRH6_22490 [Streptomyces sp. NPDC056749]
MLTGGAAFEHARRSGEEAHLVPALVEHVLGEVLRHDEKHDSHLRA